MGCIGYEGIYTDYRVSLTWGVLVTRVFILTTG